MGRRKDSSQSYEIGKGRPPKASQWKKGQSGNPRGKARGPLSDSELIERLFRRLVEVVDHGEKVQRCGFEIIFKQLLAKESACGPKAARTRDRYHRFALAGQASGGFLLRYPQSDFTRQFAAELKQGQVDEPGPATPEAKAQPVTPKVDDPGTSQR
jgi:hypothetical protein